MLLPQKNSDEQHLVYLIDTNQIQLKIKKFDELMIELKMKYLKDSVFYSELHKLDEKIQEISKLVDNNKD